ncbi:MAG: AzlC family ABC transporter permease [Ruthenibacterium sp.]
MNFPHHKQAQTAQNPAVQNSFFAGFTDGIPIGFGYLSVSITFGMMAVAGGLPVWAAVAISMTNVTSAGQFAGIGLMMTGGSLFEMALTQLIINLRYALMSLSLSQKMERHVNLIDRLLFSFMMTDEVFAVAGGQKGAVGKRYLFGLMIAPYCGWALGTLCGAVANEFLPPSLRSALGIAIYGMFLAILIPVAKQSKSVLSVILLSVTLSCVLHYLPVFSNISSGFSIILCTVIAASVGAYFAPVREEASIC